MTFRIQKMMDIPAVQAAVDTIPDGRCFLASAHVFKTFVENAWFNDGTTYNSRGDKIDIKRGQLVISLRTFADQARISVKTLRNALKILEKVGLITRETSRRHTVITLPFYNFYHNSTGIRIQKGTQKFERKVVQIDEIEYIPPQVETKRAHRHINNYKKEYCKTSISLLPDNKSHKGDMKGIFQDDRNKSHHVEPPVPPHKTRELSREIKRTDVTSGRHRERLLEKIIELNPCVEKPRTLAYMIQAARTLGIKDRKAFLFTLLTKPKWMPQDNFLIDAGREIARNGSRKRREHIDQFGYTPPKSWRESANEFFDQLLANAIVVD